MACRWRSPLFPGGGPMQMRLSKAVLGISILVLATAWSAQAIVNNSDGPGPATGVADGFAIVNFTAPPLAEWPNAARLKNGKLDFTAGKNGQYQASLSHARNDFKQF